MTDENKMQKQKGEPANIKFRLQKIIMILLSIASFLSACAPQTPVTPTVDIIGTTAAQLAARMLTETAAAIPPTPLPPTETPTPTFTITPEAPTEKPVLDPPSVVTFAGCWAGPGDTYTLISNIDPSIRKSGRQVVTLLGVGSIPGWYIIRNPYFNNPCWIQAENLQLDPRMELADYPVMTPPAP